MSDDPEAALVLREWVSRAEGDIGAASKLLEAEGPAWVACFHAQRAAKKHLKALLVQGGTHDRGNELLVVRGLSKARDS